MIPNNLITPFISGDIIQVVILGIFTGTAILVVRSSVPSLLESVNALMIVVSKMTSMVAGLVDPILYICLVRTVLTIKPSDIAQCTEMSMMTICSFIVSGVICGIYLRIKYKVSSFNVIKKTMPAMIIGFTTGSGVLATPVNIQLVKDKLGIREDIVNLWTPVSLSFMAPQNYLIMLTNAIFIASVSNTPINLIWLITLCLTCYQVSIAQPKGCSIGGYIALLTIMLEQMNLPAEYLGLMAIYVALVDNIGGFYNVYI